MMNNRIQNGSNNAVISAIKDLKTAINSKSGGNTYNVNGVTYDDGSNISSAVQAIVRAAVTERRI
jgi:Tfp pilus assembly protein PilX